MLTKSTSNKSKRIKSKTSSSTRKSKGESTQYNVEKTDRLDDLLSKLLAQLGE